MQKHILGALIVFGIGGLIGGVFKLHTLAVILIFASLILLAAYTAAKGRN